MIMLGSVLPAESEGHEGDIAPPRGPSCQGVRGSIREALSMSDSIGAPAIAPSPGRGQRRTPRSLLVGAGGALLLALAAILAYRIKHPTITSQTSTSSGGKEL